MKDRKLFFVDIESTGLDPIKNDIIQLGGLIEINGKIVEEIDFVCQPFRFDTIQTAALEVNKTTIADLKTYQTPQNAHRKLKQTLEKYVDKYDKNDKFSVCGYNVRFDVDFLTRFFSKCGDKYWGSLCDYHLLSVDVLLHVLDYKGLIRLDNYKLVTACKYFFISLDAHNALSDIKATRELFLRLLEYLK